MSADDCRPAWWREWSDRLFSAFPAPHDISFLVAMNVCISDTASIREIAGRLKCEPADVIDAFDDLAKAGLLAAVVAPDGDTALVQPLHDGRRSLM
jgi:hypothetical protein